MMSRGQGPRGPVPESKRIPSLDAMRGFALLGILIMNIQSFSMIYAAYFNPTAYGDLSGVHRWVWILSHLFADQKFMTIFSMLFGAGIVLMAERAEAIGRSAAPLHVRRMLLLIAFGAAHAYLLWYGDILVIYGMSGMVVYLFRRRSSRTPPDFRGRHAGDRIGPFRGGWTDSACLAGIGPPGVHRDVAANPREHRGRTGDLSRWLAGADGRSRSQVPGVPHRCFSLLGPLAKRRPDAHRHGPLQAGVLPTSPTAAVFVLGR